MTHVLIRAKQRETTQQRKRGHVKTEAETGWCYTRQWRPRATGSWKRQGRSLGGSRALSTPSSQTSGLQNCERIHFCCVSRQSCGNLLQQPQTTNTGLRQLIQSPEQNSGMKLKGLSLWLSVNKAELLVSHKETQTECLCYSWNMDTHTHTHTHTTLPQRCGRSVLSPRWVWLSW